jgi:hypothetical protein
LIGNGDAGDRRGSDRDGVSPGSDGGASKKDDDVIDAEFEVKS